MIVRFKSSSGQYCWGDDGDYDVERIEWIVKDDADCGAADTYGMVTGRARVKTETIAFGTNYSTRSSTTAPYGSIGAAKTAITLMLRAAIARWRAENGHPLPSHGDVLRFLQAERGERILSLGKE